MDPGTKSYKWQFRPEIEGFVEGKKRAPWKVDCKPVETKKINSRNQKLDNRLVEEDSVWKIRNKHQTFRGSKKIERKTTKGSEES